MIDYTRYFIQLCELISIRYVRLNIIYTSPSLKFEGMKCKSMYITWSPGPLQCPTAKKNIRERLENTVCRCSGYDLITDPGRRTHALQEMQRIRGSDLRRCLSVPTYARTTSITDVTHTHYTRTQTGHSDRLITPRLYSRVSSLGHTHPSLLNGAAEIHSSVRVRLEVERRQNDGHVIVAEQQNILSLRFLCCRRRS